MTRDQAGELFALLVGVHPRTKITDATEDIWLDELGKLDYPTGAKAVQSLLHHPKFWPSPGHLDDAVAAVREQAARERQHQERVDADEAYDRMPHPPLREIPAAVELIATFTGTLPLEAAPDGVCDDGCGREGLRYRLGQVQVCVECARLRLRAGERAA